MSVFALLLAVATALVLACALAAPQQKHRASGLRACGWMICALAILGAFAGRWVLMAFTLVTAAVVLLWADSEAGKP